jgi:Fur family ferric uptake transcriptional regulator
MGSATKQKRSPYGSARVTAPRKAIARAVDEMRGAFTVEELAAVAKRHDATAGATATVYRAVAAMEKSGYLERVGSRDGSAFYARCSGGAHHHHIVCEGCGLVAAADCPLEPQLETGAVSGFVVTRHEVTLYGLCPACAKRRAR